MATTNTFILRPLLGRIEHHRPKPRPLHIEHHHGDIRPSRGLPLIQVLRDGREDAPQTVLPNNTLHTIQSSICGTYLSSLSPSQRHPTSAPYQSSPTTTQ